MFGVTELQTAQLNVVAYPTDRGTVAVTFSLYSEQAD
jgi:hypothetical protein